MSSGGGLFSDHGVEFHPSFLGILIACGVLSVFTLLYFNRVFASIVSWGIRTYTWHSYGVYIDIQALQISLLAGRIFFTGFRYHGNNETILVQNGHITWAYWVRRVRQVNIGGEKGTSAAETSAKLPCRVRVSLMGLEWFIYNRSPAYDSVLAGLTRSDGPDETQSLPDEPVTASSSRAGAPKSRLRRRSGRQGAHPTTPSSSMPNAATEKRNVTGGAVSHDNPPGHPSRSDTSSSTDSQGPSAGVENEDSDLPLFLQLLPISLTCERAAVVMGNENTKAVLIIKAKEMSGEVDASETETLDPYRQYYRFHFKKPVIEMKENMDFKEDQADRAVRDKQVTQGSLSHPKQSFLRGQRRRLRDALKGMVPFWNKSVESLSPSDPDRRIGAAASQIPGSSHWQGLSRYLDDDAEDQMARWASCEYAAVPTLLDSPEASLTVFWDAAGKVGPLPSHTSQEKPAGQSLNINGAPPPAWGITLSIGGGTINYGPWADRNRADLQRVFVPSLCRDAVPARPLRPGETRVATQFKLYVELTKDTVIRIPTREASKNWRWKGKEPVPKKPVVGDTRKARRSKKSDQPADLHPRPHGWLDLRIPENSTISYLMDMVAGPLGYTTALDIDLPSTEISSSINHGLLLKSGRQRISCDLSTPLGWNALRQWYFRFDTEQLDLYLLREHVFLFTDLIDDWTSGPPVDYLVFTPFKYHLELRLHNIRLFMNLNDANIINNPTDPDDNTYLIISSPLLTVGTCIAADIYRPSESSVPFDVRTEAAAFELHLPPWNTQAQFLTSKEVGRLENLVIEGAYHYHATTSSSNTDTLILKISGQSPTVQLYGFTVRYFMKIKDNYFGEDIHFKTLEEYQDVLRLKEENPDAEPANKPPPKKTNDLDVMLSIRADDPKILLPANLYSSQRYIEIDTASLCLDLRFTNYYMDLDLVIAPLHLSLGNALSGAETPMSTSTSSTQMFLDGLHIYGHRLFGLPPVEPTYMCNWDLSLGALTGECTTEFLMTLIHAGKAFAFTFDDDENALITFSSIITYDVTFLRVFVHSVRLWLHVEDAAFLFSTDAIDIIYNDWARSHYSRRANIDIPNIKLSCINSESATRHKVRPEHVVAADALVETSLRVAIIGRKAHFLTERKLQQDLVREHDLRTNRTPFLILPGLGENDGLANTVVDPPAQSVPPVPLPIRPEVTADDVTSLRSKTSSRKTRSLRHKSSFLSFESSTQSSVIKASSSRRSNDKGKLPERHIGYQSRSGDRLAAMSSHTRELSPSTRHSAFYSMTGDSGEPQDSGHHNKVAFSSQYFAPYFPLENVYPSYGDAIIHRVDVSDKTWVDFESVTFDLDDVDPRLFDEDYAHSGILVELPKGLTAVCNPTALRYVATLLSSLQDTDPDSILDSLQMGAMGAVFDAQKDQNMQGRVSDLLVKLPHLNFRLLNSPEAHPLQEAGDEQDQYDVVLTKLSFTTRTQTSWQDAFNVHSRQSRHSFHVRLDSAEVSAAEGVRGMSNSQAAAVFRIEGILASMGEKDVTFFEAEIRKVHASTLSSKVDYLASLVQRTGDLASELGDLFADASSQEQKMVQNLVHQLTTRGHDVPDPSFLVRPSAVLRSARQHLRTFDSWKLAMRLRQIWTVIAPQTGEQIKVSCFKSLPASPAELRRDAVKAFAKWRSWDLDDLEDNGLLTMVFGSSARSSKPASQSKPVLAVVKVRQFELALNPGPKQSEISFTDISAKVEHKPVPAALETHGLGVEQVSGLFTVLGVSCGEATINLNWELCELANRVLTLMKNAQAPAPVHAGQVTSVAATPRTEQQPLEHTIHCVLSLGNGSMILDAINLNLATFCQEARASLLIRKHADKAVDTNLILSCASITSNIRNRRYKVAKLLLERPSLFVSHELQVGQATDSHVVKAAASSRYMNFVVKQDPVELAEIVGWAVRDEFSQIYSLLNDRSRPKPPSTTSSSSSSKKMAERLSAFRVNVALFMDKYTVSLPLTQSLIYTVHGTVSRAAVAANSGREIIFDFDIKENSHDMQVYVKRKNESRSISLLQIPPTNGRIRSVEEAGERFVSVFASVELVQLDASAVYSFLSALNRPEISSVIKELQHQVKSIQKHVSDVTGRVPEPTAPPTAAEVEPTTLAYAVHLSLAGIEIFGNSPLQSAKEPLAHISFALGSVRLAMSNRTEQSGPLLTYPEIGLELRRIAFEIQRGNAAAMRSCGSVAFGASVSASSRVGEDGKDRRFFHITSDAFVVTLSPETISTVVDVLGYMGTKIKDLDTTHELGYLRKFRHSSKPRIAATHDTEAEETDIIDAVLSSVTYTFQVRNIQIAWRVIKDDDEVSVGKEDLVLSLHRIEFGTRTRNSARLTIEHLQVEMVSPSYDKGVRSPNSALLPEVIFNVAYVSTANARRLAFQAVGKSLDVRLTSGFIIPAAHLNDSILLSYKNIQQASQNWNPVHSRRSPDRGAATDDPQKLPRKNILGGKRLESLLIDADFAGAVVHLTGKKVPKDLVSVTDSSTRPSSAGRQGSYLGVDETASSTTLRSPGLAWKLEYRDNDKDDPSLHAEIKIDASSNILYPSVVPLVVDISNSIQKVVSNQDAASGSGASKPAEQNRETSGPAKAKPPEEDSILTADPTAVLGRMKLNIGLRICKQEFSLSCQPIARVAATASFEDVYFTANTVSSAELGNFFAISGAFTNLQASVQHVYSRESTGSFRVQSIVFSCLNSKHLSGTSGVSAILKVSPMEVSINARQLQDFLLFREIWLPRKAPPPTADSTVPIPIAKLVTETSQGHLVQRYQQVAATAAFPWTASISISALNITVDMGQALGRSIFSITDFWVSSKKTSDWQQNLCLSFGMVGVESTGRMSGFVVLRDFKLRTSIEWPEREQALSETPLIQASVGFSQLRVKAAFDYQAFLVADVGALDFLMYNIRRSREGGGDRLIATLEGEAVQVFGTTTSAAQAVALYQAFQKLVQERRANFEASLKEIERYMQRKSVKAPASVMERLGGPKTQEIRTASSGGGGDGEGDNDTIKSPISLDTDVVVTLKALNLGVFPSTFSDHQVFKMEALNAQARFAASVEQDGRIHSMLALTLGQLRIGLAGVRAPAPPPTSSPTASTPVTPTTAPAAVTSGVTGSGAGPTDPASSSSQSTSTAIATSRALAGELSVEEVVRSATGSRGGTILKVPRVEAVMQTWQRPESKRIDYIFRSAFEGKVEVGWNYSRISYIRGMWANHSRTLTQAWGRELPGVTAIRVTGALPEAAGTTGGEQQQPKDKDKGKITAEVKVPVSRYEYVALEPPVIETPQLRDMGEATPPLEWIGVNRERLPNLTHQIVIVALLELAGEVEDAYERILGSS